MKYIIAGICVGIVFILLLYLYYSNTGIPNSIDELAKKVDELTKEVKELRKKIAERSEDG